jgi:hypothetical protein
LVCSLARHRLRAGWPEHLAYSAPKGTRLQSLAASDY